MSSRHVVFGVGQVGSQVVTQLVDAGEEVIAVSRSGAVSFAGATNVAGDATNPTFTVDVCDGADANREFLARRDDGDVVPVDEWGDPPGELRWDCCVERAPALRPGWR